MAKRKTLSRKTRFEVFKRDKFTCQYCGNTPPDSVLECDHIVPVCEGGDNEYENLITSCYDCNRGKAGHSLDEMDAEQVQLMKFEQIAQLTAYNNMLRQAIEQRADTEKWLRLRVAESLDWRDLSDSEAKSLRTLMARLSIDKICEAADIAGSKRIRGFSARWRYFCGVCWGMIKEGA